MCIVHKVKNYVTCDMLIIIPGIAKWEKRYKCKMEEVNINPSPGC